MGIKLDLSGNVFGRLSVIRENGRNKYGAVLWRCRCECGNEVDAIASALKSGYKKSCGCLLVEDRYTRTLTHGHCKKGKVSPEFIAWCQMIARCTNDHPTHKNYFGRGIKVCQRWLNSFEDFLSDVGFRPSLKHSLDRFPNNNGNYEPDNVRWATRTEQNRNQRSNRNFTHNGMTMLLTDWATYFGVHASTLSDMVKKWDFKTLYDFYLKKNGELPVVNRIGRGGLSLKKTMDK